jgi:hypothetical protein
MRFAVWVGLRRKEVGGKRRGRKRTTKRDKMGEKAGEPNPNSERKSNCKTKYTKKIRTDK